MTSNIKADHMTLRTSTGTRQSIYCVGAYSYARCLQMFLEQFAPRWP